MQPSSDNTGVGESALLQGIPVAAWQNTAPRQRLRGYTITSGTGNIAIGVDAGDVIVTGNTNIDIGNSGFGDESGVIRIGTIGDA